MPKVMIIIVKLLGLVFIFAIPFLLYLAVISVLSTALFLGSALMFLVAGLVIYKADEIIEFESKIVKLKMIQKDIFIKADELGLLEKKLRLAVQKFIESFYLTIVTRNRFPPPENISERILANLDELAVFAIEDDKEREEWLKGINALLENKKQGVV